MFNTCIHCNTAFRGPSGLHIVGYQQNSSMYAMPFPNDDQQISSLASIETSRDGRRLSIQYM
nr:unnamed protein product [Callosobruchus chinensis]